MTTYLLDTNVVCEATAKHPNPRVLAWCSKHSEQSVLSCVTLGEIWKGIHLMPEGRRRASLAAWAAGIERDFSDVTLPLDAQTLKLWGQFYARHEAKGFNMSVLDSLIAATALAHGLTIATRNLADFPPDVKTLNPWES